MLTLRLPLLAAALLALMLASAPAEAQRRSTATDSPPTRADRATATRSFADVEHRLDQLARRIAVSLDEARRGHDQGVARCLNDHLSQVHGLLRQVEHRRQLALKDAPDERGVAGLMRVASVFQQRLGVLDEGSRRCQGGDLGPSTGTEVRTEIDPSVPQDDPARLPGEDRRPFDDARPVVGVPPPISATI